MYPNLNAEIARQGLTYEKIASETGFALSTVWAKLNGKSPITLNDAHKLKRVVKSDLPIEFLFATSEEVTK